MKKHSYPFIFCFLLFFTACDKDQSLTNQFDGEWEIQQIVFTSNGQDSIASAPIGVFYFEKRKLGNGNCSGYYELEGYDRGSIGYNAQASPKEVHISTLSEAEIIFRGTYQINNFSSSRITFSGTAEAGKEYDVVIDLKKK
ncbi:hypothetical protein [Nafulsella turpanensis]|uniref:hypothetical protein n=1 Tax=Nafulsella turpanensis TaxID=1265690 RepID=UPI0003481560|nr:hypothetical protein [Nafulsella turpanensis]